MLPTSRRAFLAGTAATAATFPPEWESATAVSQFLPSPALAGLIEDLEQAHVVLDAAFARVRELSNAGLLTGKLEEEITDPPWDAKDASYDQLMAYQPTTWIDFGHKLVTIDDERHHYDGSLTENDTETIFADCRRLLEIGGAT